MKEILGEKTEKSGKTVGRSPAGKAAAKRSAARAPKEKARKDDVSNTAARAKAAKKPKKKAATTRKAATRKTAAKKPAATRPDAASGRKRSAKAAKATVSPEERSETMADSENAQAERRIAGGRDAQAAIPSANQNRASAEAPPAPAAACGFGFGAEPPQHEATHPQAPPPKRTKSEPRARSGEPSESGPRPNTLVPTNGIHATERRLKRRLHQNRGLMFLIAATLLGILILGEQTTPPDMSEFEQRIEASQANDPHPAAAPAAPPAGIIQPRVPSAKTDAAGPDRSAGRLPGANPWELDDQELVEMERLLARLDLGPSAADGVVDQQTKTAIRLYQQIAGLPVDGAPSRALLADMREVANILDNGR